MLFIADLNEPEVQPVISHAKSWKTKLLKDVCRLVLFCYCGLIFNTILPVIGDAIAHTFWEKQHLASAHQLNGKNHVGTEILKIELQTAKDKGTGSSKTSEEDFSHILVTTIVFEAVFYFIFKPAYPHYSWFSTVCFPQKHYPPPRAQD